MPLLCRVRSHFTGFVVVAFILCHLCKSASSQVSLGRDLLEGATRTAVTVAPDSVDSEAHFWLSSRKLLFVRPAPAHRQFRVVLMDVQTGAKSLPDAFNAYASPLMPRIETMTVSYADSKLVEHIYAPPPSVPSPDGKWLLWQIRPPSTLSWCVATLYGSQHRQYKAAPGADTAFWLPEGQDWIELSRGADPSLSYRRALIHSLSGKNRTRTIQWTGIGDGIALGITRQRSVLVYYPNCTPPAKIRRVEMAEVGIAHKIERAHRFTVALSKPAQVAEVILSPGGDHLAWLLTDDVPYSEHGEVWLSDARGQQMRLLGWLEGESAWHRALHWLPDGKHLSFLHQSVVWTVAIASGEKR